ncbi:rCG31926 [Rattus norvegicus]|uniref:RCG31926 n=1 Tax=Rattus norvegicus TaxID=10116 RepID=A6KDN8_RAT|nr:rCG31926 [Rattus norvegicus]
MFSRYNNRYGGWQDCPSRRQEEQPVGEKPLEHLLVRAVIRNALVSKQQNLLPQSLGVQDSRWRCRQGGSPSLLYSLLVFALLPTHELNRHLDGSM